jgi:hypothetical protein
VATIAIGIGGFVVFGEILVMLLVGCSSLVLVLVSQPLFRARIVADAALASAESDVAVAGDEAPIDTLAVIKGVVDVASVHMHGRGVVEEVVAAPLTAGKTNAAVAEAVVHAAVVADVPSPVAFMEKKVAVIPAPAEASAQSAMNA